MNIGLGPDDEEFPNLLRMSTHPMKIKIHLPSPLNFTGAHPAQVGKLTENFTATTRMQEVTVLNQEIAQYIN